MRRRQNRARKGENAEKRTKDVEAHVTEEGVPIAGKSCGLQYQKIEGFKVGP